MEFNSDNITTDYEDLMDQQFDLLQDMINLSDYIIYQEYEDLDMLQTGAKLFDRMIEVNKLNYLLVKDFSDQKEVKFIIEQYRKYQLDPLTKLENEVKNLEITLKEIKNIRENYNKVDEDLLVEIMNTIEMIATYNLRDYENTLKSAFDKL